MEAQVNIRGWVGSTIEVRETAKGDVLKFRLATTSRYKRDGEWVDGGTVWMSVNAWRALARNAGFSLRKGDPVMVMGKLRTESWLDKAGDVREDKVIEAFAIGHDLSMGRAVFQRVRPEVSEVDAEEAGADVVELAARTEPEPEEPARV